MAAPARSLLAPTTPPKVQSFELEGAFPPSAALSSAGEKLVSLVNHWDDARAAELFDGAVDLGRMKSRLEELRVIRGECRVAEAKRSDGARKASFQLACEKVPVMVEITLAEATEKIGVLKFSAGHGAAGRCAL